MFSGRDPVTKRWGDGGDRQCPRKLPALSSGYTRPESRGVSQTDRWYVHCTLTAPARRIIVSTRYVHHLLVPAIAVARCPARRRLRTMVMSVAVGVGFYSPFHGYGPTASTIRSISGRIRAVGPWLLPHHTGITRLTSSRVRSVSRSPPQAEVSSMDIARARSMSSMGSFSG